MILREEKLVQETQGNTKTTDLKVGVFISLNRAHDEELRKNDDLGPCAGDE